LKLPALSINSWLCHLFELCGLGSIATIGCLAASTAKLHFLLRTAAGCCHALISSLKLHCSCLLLLSYIAFKPQASLQLFAANTSFSHFKLYCSFCWQTFAATSTLM
jgi:hypothetical protein